MIKDFLHLADLSPQHNDLHRKAFTFSFAMIDKLATSAPTTDTLQPGYAQVFDDGTNRRIYYNLGGTLYFWALTAA